MEPRSPRRSPPPPIAVSLPSGLTATAWTNRPLGTTSFATVPHRWSCPRHNRRSRSGADRHRAVGGERGIAGWKLHLCDGASEGGVARAGGIEIPHRHRTVLSRRQQDVFVSARETPDGAVAGIVGPTSTRDFAWYTWIAWSAGCPLSTLSRGRRSRSIAYKPHRERLGVGSYASNDGRGLAVEDQDLVTSARDGASSVVGRVQGIDGAESSETGFETRAPSTGRPEPVRG